VLAARNEARYEAGVTVAVDGVGVSGTSECACFATRRCGLAGTAVCVELVEAEELEGVGEDGREGVGVTVAEEGAEWGLVGGCEDEFGSGGGAGTGVGVGAILGFRTSDARYCSCRDVRDTVRRYEQSVANTGEPH
jgi:hypothetical protein